ncbi:MULTISPECIES: adenylate/guanylate cyclase domain-containing protein [unclassified Bradyrhizobium]|uniref:adenylate/guanylate cyclase domain-containing protein n=1 Tax=unclassified Bradyrhizobium TaxID=2631580 RepID=UPI001FFB36AD|nr:MULTISPECIES: adenylate/guanylate cyclase domain-containing protein [unclassified Bradyrhizobium]
MTDESRVSGSTFKWNVAASQIWSSEATAFLNGGGDAGRLIAERDWSATLGPLDAWPQCLKTARSILLRSPVPHVMLWGEDGIDRHRGNLVKTTGDGVLATFDGPGRAIRCALLFSSAAHQIGLPVRAGLHTRHWGPVHAAARVMSQSAPDEVLVSRVVTDLVAGTGLRFSERGSYELKGLPGKWFCSRPPVSLCVPTSHLSSTDQAPGKAQMFMVAIPSRSFLIET